MSASFTQDVPLHVIDGMCRTAADDAMCRVTFDYRPGMDACGPAFDHGGLPAEPAEIEIAESWYLGASGQPIATLLLAEHEEEKIVEWLFENWEPPTGPDPDDERDRRRDDELTTPQGE